MNHELPCEIVQDLLPSYVDGLTSPVTNEAVAAHLEGCEACRAVHGRMTAPPPPEPAHEVDYLKKLKRRHRAVWLSAVGLFLLLALALFGTIRFHAADPEVAYDERSQTVSVTGTAGTDFNRLDLSGCPDDARLLTVAGESFYLSAYLSTFDLPEETQTDYIAGLVARTDKSFGWIRNYLAENAPGCYDENTANEYVTVTIDSTRRNLFGYTTESGLNLNLGDTYRHRDTLFLLALMGSERVEWQQLGMIEYLVTLNPYSEIVAEHNARAIDLTGVAYSDVYFSHGGHEYDLTGEDIRLLHDAASLECLTEGFYWSGAYESYPLCETYFYSGPNKAVGGNSMSVFMAASFTA